MEELKRLDLPVRISARPNEVPDAIPFKDDETHRAYDADAVNRFWRALAQADRVFKIFRGRFIGKCSPVHLFWGRWICGHSLFGAAGAGASGRHPGPARSRDARSVLARSEQLRILGGNRADRLSGVLLVRLCVAAGVCRRRASGRMRRSSARTSASSSCRTIACASRLSPDETLLEFLQSTYELAADLAKWDRPAMERPLL